MACKNSLGIWLPRLVIGANTAAAGTGSRMNCCIGTFPNLVLQGWLGFQGQAEQPEGSKSKGTGCRARHPGTERWDVPYHTYGPQTPQSCQVQQLLLSSFHHGENDVSLYLHLPTSFLKPNFSFTSNVTFYHSRWEKKGISNLRAENNFLDKVTWKSERGISQLCISD